MKEPFLNTLLGGALAIVYARQIKNLLGFFPTRFLFYSAVTLTTPEVLILAVEVVIVEEFKV